MSESDTSELIQLTVQLLSAYVGNNSVAVEDLAGLIASTRTALSAEPAPAAVKEATYVAAVSIRKSLASPNHLLSLIDGKPYKLLKRHLATHGLTPDQYRARYNLPKDYPMVARAYAEERRGVASRIGLGLRPSKQSSPSPAAAANTAALAAVTANASPSVEAPVQDAPAHVEGKEILAAKPAPAKSTATRKAAAKPARAKVKSAEPSTSAVTTEAAPPVPAASPAASKVAPPGKKPAKALAAKPVPGQAAVDAVAESPIPSEPAPASSAPAPRKAAKASKTPAGPGKASEGRVAQPEKKARKKLGVRIPDAKAD